MNAAYENPATGINRTSDAAGSNGIIWPQRASLHRTLNPRSVAVVGISESSGFAKACRVSMQSDTEFLFVHPKYSTLFGHPTFPELRALGRPVDAVLTAVSAARTVDVVEQAAEIGAGGVITFAAGFAELGGEGAAMQRRIREVAIQAGMSLVGPNGSGIVNAVRGLDLTMLAGFPRRVGGLSSVTHSGAMTGAISAAGWRAGGVGLNLLISAGNEAVTDVADYLDYLVEDEATRVIVLAVEKIRRPTEFFDAARRALAAGKPIIAIKLGRSERGQRMAASHTGTLTTDAWIYDVAMRQAGIILARDIDEVVDRAQFLEQLPRQKWTEVRGLAVLTLTGGFAQMASDLADETGVDVPEVPRLKPWIADKVPGGSVPNPLDATAFMSGLEGRWAEIIDKYADTDEFDTLIYLSQHADWDVAGAPTAEDFVKRAATSPKPFIIAPLAGVAGQWVGEYRKAGVAVGNGLMGCLRGLSTMAAFMRTRPDARVADPAEVPPVPCPAVATIACPEGQMLPFAETMRLLETAGIPVAPYHVVPDGSDHAAPPFPGPYVVKLADVPHRTELGAVRLGVSTTELPSAIASLRELANRHGQVRTIVVQPMINGHGEAFIGLRGNTELGPVVVFGIGGVFVEILRRISGRMAPLSDADAEELINEFADLRVIDGFRGQPAWDRAGLVRALTAAGRLAAGGKSWIESIDINPLIVTAGGQVAVDGLCLVRRDS